MSVLGRSDDRVRAVDCCGSDKSLGSEAGMKFAKCEEDPSRFIRIVVCPTQ